MHYNIDSLIDLAIKEDIGSGDHSSLSCIPEKANGKAKLLVKQDGIIAGLDIAHRVFNKIDNNLNINSYLNDGDKIKDGDIVFEVEGNVRNILQAERLVLNFMQRMSGIATKTRKYADLIKELDTKLLDTRKTTPGNRLIEKMAVKIGGGYNHRIGLYDMIMLKDNHIDFAGGIKNAVEKANEYIKINKLEIDIEIEVRNFDELKEVLDTGNIQRIMLDNFSIKNTKSAIALINKSYETESSGGITFNNLKDYALCGVDYISVGALTHQINSLDLSLKADF
ncbi:MAG: carboxylating nicotinate-nucleotide diphosphorylase [Bacteroidales bacterium]|nr:carboxylating nicotinate-nucleotide diphosphorylase [Bacteroidales bacterium]